VCERDSDKERKERKEREEREREREREERERERGERGEREERESELKRKREIILSVFMNLCEFCANVFKCMQMGLTL